MAEKITDFEKLNTAAEKLLESRDFSAVLDQQIEDLQVRINALESVITTIGLLTVQPTPINPPVDDVIAGPFGWRTFVFFGSNGAPGWKPAASSYTVPEGRQLLIVSTDATGITQLDGNGRRARLLNVTDGAEVLGPTAFQSNPALTNARDGVGYQWGPDLADPRLISVPAGKTVRLEIWNADANERAVGAIVVAREVPA